MEKLTNTRTVPVDWKCMNCDKKGVPGLPIRKLALMHAEQTGHSVHVDIIEVWEQVNNDSRQVETQQNHTSKECNHVR